MGFPLICILSGSWGATVSQGFTCAEYLKKNVNVFSSANVNDMLDSSFAVNCREIITVILLRPWPFYWYQNQ